MEFAKIKLKPVHSQLRHRANSGAGFPLHPEIHNTVSRNDPAAPQDHCGKSRNRTQDLCPRSLTCLMSHHISRRYHISATKFESNKNCFQQVIFSTNAWVRWRHKMYRPRCFCYTIVASATSQECVSKEASPPKHALQIFANVPKEVGPMCGQTAT